MKMKERENERMTWEVKAESKDRYHVVDDKAKSYIAVCLSKQQAQLVARAPQMMAALKAIVALKAPGWGNMGDVLKVYHQHKEIARTAIAAVKGERDEDELV